MDIIIPVGQKKYRAKTARPLQLALPVRLDGTGLEAFGAPAAAEAPYEAGTFIGDVRKGGSCNCGIMVLTPHCNGTHTECVGHITAERIFVQDVMDEFLMPAAVLSVMPQTAGGCGEDYNGSLDAEDLVITERSLEAMPLGRDIPALIIRTLPNGEDKKARDFSAAMPPYFTRQAMELIATSGIRHLLVDLPSVDRMDDGGALLNHRIFWGVEERAIQVNVPSPKTITELIYVPDAVADGLYLLNLQVAPLLSDAAPSRPVLYELEEQ